MATSPREELRIVTVTQFEKNGDHGEWYWHTDAPDGDVLGEAVDGHVNLEDAVLEFLEQQGYDPSVDASAAHFSKLIVVGDEYHMRRYAYGAPDPFDPADPVALASLGYQPPKAVRDAG